MNVVILKILSFISYCRKRVVIHSPYQALHSGHESLNWERDPWECFHTSAISHHPLLIVYVLIENYYEFGVNLPPTHSRNKLEVMERFLLLAVRQFLNLRALISVDNVDYRIVGQFTVFVKANPEFCYLLITIKPNIIGQEPMRVQRINNQNTWSVGL